MLLYSKTIIVSLAGLVSGQGGSADCPCLEWAQLTKYLKGDPGSEHLVYAPSGSNGPQYEYPANYGNAECKMHDKGLPPMCTADNAPSWCDKKWCYVYKPSCNLAAIKSQFFEDVEDLYFSFETCSGAGSTNTFAVAPMDKAVKDLIEVIETNLETVQQQIETSWKSMDSSPDKPCDVPGTCPCTTCSSGWPAWGKPVDFSEVGASLATESEPAVVNKASCLLKAIGDPYSKVAAVESDKDGKRVGYQYFADQASGSYLQWPAVEWCPRGEPGGRKIPYDPRLRPWYASAATGPKDVVLVVDVSGSMGKYERYLAAAEAVVKALDTLSWRDFASIVTFDGALSEVYSDEMVPVTEDTRGSMQAWARKHIVPKGGTKFSAGLWKAFKIIEKSVAAGKTAMCEKAILFLTDGEDNSWQESDYEYIMGESIKQGAYVFTYALGFGADTKITKRLACDNRGVFYKVDDGADLGTIMAMYYAYFAAGTQNCKPSWSKYPDPVSGNDLYAACSVIYDRSGSEPALLGASCMDANMIADVRSLRANDKFQEFVCAVSDSSKKCRANYLKECHREGIRAAYSPDSVCGTSGTTEKCPCVDPTCEDDENFVDSKGYFCDTWVGDSCETRDMEKWGYDSGEATRIRTKCKKSCGLCDWKSADQCPVQLTCPATSGPQCRACSTGAGGIKAKMTGMNIDGREHCCSVDGAECGPVKYGRTAVGAIASDADGCDGLTYSLPTLVLVMALTVVFHK